MEQKDFDVLKLDNQLCFPLYACAREIVKKYKPFLDAIDLTYTQYITMMVLWEHRRITSKALGEKLYLDSGTLTPVLKKLEEKGLVTRARDPMDERNLVVALTDAGEALKTPAARVPRQMAGCISLEPAEAQTLYLLLHKLLSATNA
ncbi:MAG: MarR family transcriptional regulator [Clostridia bacterium]|nr:MarR family transcriptional regulator [Clostridia bacterium]